MGKEERIYLLKQIKEFRDSNPEGAKIIKDIAKDLWDTERVDHLVNEQLGVLLDEIKSRSVEVVEGPQVDERTTLLREINEYESRGYEKEIKSVLKDLFDLSKVEDATNDQLKSIITGIRRADTASAATPETLKPKPLHKETLPLEKYPQDKLQKRRPPPKKPQKREIISLQDYADQHKIPSFFLKMIKDKYGEEHPFVLRAGLLYKMDLKYGRGGYEISAVPLHPTWEGDGKSSVFKGRVIVYTKGGKVRLFEDIGTATLKNARWQEGFLDEMASTRATNRAMRLATAMGLCSVEELPEYADVEDGSDVYGED